MPLSSRSTTTGKPADPAQTAFEWLGSSDASSYYGPAPKPAPAPAPKPAAPLAPVAASSGLSSRAGEGQTVISAQQPQPAPVKKPEPVVQKTPIKTPGATKQFNTAEEENAYVKTLTTQEARRYFGDAWGKMSYGEAKARGAMDVYKSKLLPFQYERDASKEYYRKLATVPPEDQGVVAGEGFWTRTAKAALSNVAEMGIDAAEILGLAFAPEQAYPLLKGMTVSTRRQLGMPEEGIASEASRLRKVDEYAQMGGDVKNMVVMMYDGFKTSITGMASWAQAKARGDDVAADEISSQMGFDLRQGLSSFGGLGDKVRQTWGVSADKEAVYVKGEKVRDLTEPEKEVAGGMQAVGALVNSVALWSKVSPWIEKGVIATNAAKLAPLAEAHPILFRGLITNAVEETTQAVVSGIAGVPYNFGDTVFGLGTQFIMTSVGGIRSQVPELKDLDVDGAMRQADDAAQAFVMSNKRMPSSLELQDILGSQIVPGTRKSWNEVNRVMAKRYGQEFGENRLIYKDTVDKFGDPARPEGDADWQLPEGIKKGEAIDVPIDRITYDPEQIKVAAADELTGDGSRTGAPIELAREGNKIMLINGNHRLVEALQRGDTSIKGAFISDPQPGAVARTTPPEVPDVPLSQLDARGVDDAKLGSDMIKAGADPEIAARTHDIIGDGVVRDVEYFGQKVEAVDRTFNLPKIDPDNFKANPPTKLGDLELDPESIRNVFADGGTGIEGKIQNPIQIFYDLETGRYTLQNGYHRLVEAVNRGEAGIQGEVIFGKKPADAFYATPNNTRLMTVQEVRTEVPRPADVAPRGNITPDEKVTQLPREDEDMISQISPTDRRFVRDNVDKTSVTETSQPGVRRLQRLEEAGLVRTETDPQGQTVGIFTDRARAFATTVRQDLPPDVAPRRAATAQQVYGQRYHTSTFQGQPVITNSYILEFGRADNDASFGSLKRGDIPEDAVTRILEPAAKADVRLQPYAFRDEGIDNAAAESMFLRSQEGDFSRVDLGYLNYFIRKYGDDIQLFGQGGRVSMSPVTVRSADGRMLGMIMPLRMDSMEPPRPLQISPRAAAPTSGLSSRSALPATTARLLKAANWPATKKGLEDALYNLSNKDDWNKAERALYDHVKGAAPQKPGKAPPVARKGGGGGKEPPKKPRASEGDSERSRLSSRKKPAKQPKPLKETQPARSSRLRDRMEKPAKAELEPKAAAIMKFLQEEFTAPIRIGKNSRGSRGTFYPDKNVIRIKDALNIETSAHEIGHYLDNEYGILAAVRNGRRFIEPYRTELLNLGERTSKPSYTTGEKIQEGIAEFVRRYIVNPESLDVMGPNFKKFFEEQMPASALQLFETVRDAHTKLMAESPEYRVKSHISTEQPKVPLRDRVQKATDSFFAAVDDDLLMLRKYTRQAERMTGRDIPFKNDPYVLARLVRGLDGKTLQFLAPNLRPFDGEGKPIDQRSLGSILEDVGTRRSDFEAYLVAKRAQDLHKQKIKTGILPEDADAVVKLMEERHNDFPALQKEIVSWNRALLQYAQQRGFLSAEQVKNMTEGGDNYVPFFRVIDELTVKGNARKKLADVSNPFKKIKGSTRQIVSPIESMTKNAYVIMSAVDRNRVGQAIVRLAREHPDLGAYVEKIPASSKPITLNVEDVMKRLGIEEATNAGQETITMFVHGSKPNVAGENIMMVVENGKPGYYSVDPMLYKAITAMSDENANILIRMLAKPASLLRAGATLTPEFIGRNPLRDQISAGMYSRGNYVPYLDLVRGIVETVRRGDDYQRAAIGGAMQAAFVSMDRASLKNHTDRIFATKGERVAHYFLHPLDALRALSEFGELGTRIGESRKVFAKELKRTGDFEEAMTRSAFAARNVTLDFSRRGWAGKSMNQITAFWNATVQDITKFSRELTGKEKGGNPAAVAMKAAALITIPSIAFYEMSKNDERYQELPRWQKDYFWIAALPGLPLIRIPKPFLPGMIFGSLITRTLEATDKQDMQPLRDFFVSLRESSIPGITPTAMLPIVEYATNHSLFFGRDIVPFDQQRLLPEDQYGIYTAEIYKELGDRLGVAPLKIESLVYGYTAGLGRYASGMIDFLGAKTDLLPEKPVPPEDITQYPLIKAFTISDLSTTGESLNTFYEQYSRAEKVNNSLNEAIKKQDRDRAKEIRDGNLQDLIYVTPDGSPQLVYEALGAVATLLSDLRKERETVITSTEIGAEEKTDQLLKLNAAMRMLARRALTVTRERPDSIDKLRSAIGE